jgi:hypothetical protein
MSIGVAVETAMTMIATLAGLASSALWLAKGSPLAYIEGWVLLSKDFVITVTLGYVTVRRFIFTPRSADTTSLVVYGAVAAVMVATLIIAITKAGRRSNGVRR